MPQAFQPNHCVQNNEDAQLHPLLKQKVIVVVFHKSENPLVGSYSAFFDNGRRQEVVFGDWSRARVISELIIMGLTTDYCVKFTMSDALQLGYKVNAITDGRHSVSIQPQDSAYAPMEISAAGAALCTLTDWEEIQE